jgi:hypothetical protein
MATSEANHYVLEGGGVTGTVDTTSFGGAPQLNVEVDGTALQGPTLEEKFLRFERRVLDAAPNRAMRIERTHALDDGVVVEAVLVDPDKGADWKIPFCAVLKVSDGRIVRDDTYGDFTKWPGMH